ncbi:MAG: MMPL family transporter [Rhodospirillaceae bacterium]
MNGGGSQADRLFAAWVAAVCRHARIVAALCAVLAVLTGVYLKNNIAVNTDTTDMLSSDLPFRQNNRKIDTLFPQLSDNLLLLLDGEAPESVDAAARRLTARLKAEPHIFGDVFDPEGDPFLEKNGLMFLTVPELEKLVGKLADAQPFLASLWAAPGLPTLFGLLKDGLTEGTAAGRPRGDLARVMNRLALAAERLRAGELQPISWQRLLSGDEGDGKGAAPEPARRAITLRPPLDFSKLQPAAMVLTRLDGLRRDLGLTSGDGIRLRISGSVALRHDELVSVKRGMGLAGVLSLALVMVLLVIGLRRAGAVVAVLMTLAAGLLWTAGFAIWALGALNLISVAFAVLFIGLSVDFGIHFTLRYGEFRDGGADKPRALADAAAAGGGGLLLCAVAAAIAFYSFLPTDYVGLAQLGMIAGTGMFIAFAANLTLLPALLMLLPGGWTVKKDHAPRGGAIVGGLRRNARKVLWATAVVACAGLALLPRVRFDFDPLNLQDGSLESVSVIHELASLRDASTYAATTLAKSADAAQPLTGRLEALPEVRKVVSIGTFLPAEQQEKIAIVQELALFLLPSLPGDGPKISSAPEAREASVKGLTDALVETAGAGGLLAAAAGRLNIALTALPPGDLAALEQVYLATFPATALRLRRILDPGPVSVDTLPRDLHDRFIAATGEARLMAFPAEDLRRPENLNRFVAAVRGIDRDASGPPVTIFEAGRAVVGAFQIAGFIAVAAILALLGIILRRPFDVTAVFAPLTLAAVLTAGFSVLAGVPFNFANIIVLPLLFGLGVASGIHLVLRERGSGADGGAFETSTPRAVMFSALTTIGSFGSIALSSHPGTASMGVLLTAAIILTMVCTMTVLPALLALRSGPAAGD